MLPSVLPTETDHVPVLADEVLNALDPRPGNTIVDCTFGSGGHSELLPELRREREAVLVVQRVVMFSEQHLHRVIPLRPTLTHNHPPVHT